MGGSFLCEGWSGLGRVIDCSPAGGQMGSSVGLGTRAGDVMKGERKRHAMFANVENVTEMNELAMVSCR